jgi:hypothetical protein
VPPDFSLESDVIRPKLHVQSDLSFFICIIRKQEPSDTVVTHYPVAPGEGMVMQLALERVAGLPRRFLAGLCNREQLSAPIAHRMKR